MRHEPETEDDAVPYGTSHSGCGAPSALAETDGVNLQGKRQPSRYRPEHRRKRVRYIEMPMGYRTPFLRVATASAKATSPGSTTTTPGAMRNQAASRNCP
jgi:hypothetical protein